MFKKKSQSTNIHIEIKASGTIIYSGRIIDMDLNEKAIIEKSIKFYNDPEPCYIHKGAIKTRLYEEIRVFCNEYTKKHGNTIPYEDIPVYIREYLTFEKKYDIYFSDQNQNLF